MGDPVRLTLPCEFGNGTSTFMLADLGGSINLMSFSFYQKLELPELKATKMTIHMANRSVTYPRGIVEDLLVKIGKFILPIDFMVMDMKEDGQVPIILGRPLLSTAWALVDFHESRLTLRVREDEMTFDIQERVKEVKGLSDVLLSDETNELHELERLMEADIQVRGNSRGETKATKLRASTLMIFEVFAFTRPKILDNEVNEDDDMSSSDNEDDWWVEGLKLEEINLEVDKKEAAANEVTSMVEEKTQGLKRKLDTCSVQSKRENSKKAYIRRVQAYKRRWKEQRVKRELPLPPDAE